MNSILDEVLIDRLAELLGTVERQLLAEARTGPMTKRIYDAMDLLRSAQDATTITASPSPMHGNSTVAGLTSTALAFEALSDVKRFLNSARVQTVADGSLVLDVDQAAFEKLKVSHAQYRAEMGKFLKSS